MIIKQNILYGWEMWFLRRWRETAISVGFSVLALGIYVFSMSYSSDDYALLLQRFPIRASGRWGFHIIYNYLCMHNYLPVLSSFVGITGMALAGFELTRLWRIRSFSCRIILILLFSLYPYNLEMYVFRIVSLAFPWSYYLALVSLNQKKGWLRAMLLCLSLGIYQPALGTAMCAWGMSFLICAQNRHFHINKSDLCNHLRGWLWIVLGVVLYGIILKLTLIGVESNSRVDSFFHWKDPLRNICYILFILFIRLSFIPEYVIPLMPKIGIFLIVLMGSGILVWKSRCRWWVILLLIGAPVLAIIHTLPLAEISVPWRVSLGLIIFVLGLWTILWNQYHTKKMSLILGGFLIPVFMIVDNARMYEHHLQDQADQAMANRMAARMESLPDYRKGLKLVIIGDYSEHFKKFDGDICAEKIQDKICEQMQRKFSFGTVFGTRWGKYGILLNFLKLPMQKGTPRDETGVLSQCSGRQPWPAPSSVFIKEDKVIIILKLPEDPVPPGS